MESVLISAGKSSRMGHDKALMISNGEFWGITIIRKLLLVSDRVIVVVGYHKNEIISGLSLKLTNNELNRVVFIENKEHEKGMFSSIQCGFSHVKNGESSFFHVIDQPFISKDVYINLKIGWENSNFDYIQPIYNQKKGHPIIFSSNSIKKIIKASSELTLKSVMDSLEIGVFIESNDDSILHNINSLEELKKSNTIFS